MGALIKQVQNERFLRIKEVERRVGLKKSSIYALIKAGKFPSQIKLSERSSGWTDSSISSWIRERVELAKECKS